MAVPTDSYHRTRDLERKLASLGRKLGAESPRAIRDQLGDYEVLIALVSDSGSGQPTLVLIERPTVATDVEILQARATSQRTWWQWLWNELVSPDITIEGFFALRESHQGEFECSRICELS